MRMFTSAQHGDGPTGADAGALSWSRLRWRDRSQVRRAGVSRARWASLDTSLRRELLTSARHTHPAPLTRAADRGALHGPRREVLPPDHPQHVLARNGRRTDACYRRAEAETPAEAIASDAQRADLERAESTAGYQNGLTFFDVLTARLLAELGEQTQPEQRPITHRRGVAVDARALALREEAERRAEHTAAALSAVVLLILSALVVLAERPEQVTGAGPEAPRPDPPSPPPAQLALVRSTLTAAPPRGTVSVPSLCCAVPLYLSAA